VETEELDWLEYFSGGVPTGEYFRITLEDVQKICESAEVKMGMNRVFEICFIGLISYFEAFCKDHFASILNIMPALLQELKKNGQDTSIDAVRILGYPHDILYKMGFIVAEKLDFGSSQKINALYSSLIRVTPFSKSEMEIYDCMLRDRNLLVHHGGTYTLTYVQQAKISDRQRNRAYFDSLVITKEYVLEKLNFISGIAQKLLKANNKALIAYADANDIELSSERKKAIDAFLWWNE
jgi:hypothetical protein